MHEKYRHLNILNAKSNKFAFEIKVQEFVAGGKLVFSRVSRTNLAFPTKTAFL